MESRILYEGGYQLDYREADRGLSVEVCCRHGNHQHRDENTLCLQRG